MSDAIALSWPRHPLTLEDWERLPADETLRLELVEGVLVMSPQPYSWHQLATRRVANALDAALSPDRTALHETEVVLWEHPPTVRVPDVVVVPTAVLDGNPARFRAADVALAVEVLSEGTRRVDRVLKFSEYADAGIPRYWIVDLDGPVALAAYVLLDRDYELAAQATGPVDLEVAGHTVPIDLDALIRR